MILEGAASLGPAITRNLTAKTSLTTRYVRQFTLIRMPMKIPYYEKMLELPDRRNLVLGIHNDRREEPLIIYLPGLTFGSKYTRQGFYNSVPKALVDKSVVRLNYQWSKRNAPWPKPLQDVTFAINWIIRNLCSPERKIGIHGKYLGGTLAMSLALQAPSFEQKKSVSAFSIKDGIFDWTPYVTTTWDDFSKRNYPCIYRKYPNLESSMDIIETKYARADINVQKTMKIASFLFTKPAECFDPRVSPVLFFRTAGLEVPTAMPTMPRGCYILHHPGDRHKNAIRSIPKSSSLIAFRNTIPKIRLSVSDGGHAQEQAEEMCMLLERASESENIETLDTKSPVSANNRVELFHITSREMEKGDKNLGHWFDNALR